MCLRSGLYTNIGEGMESVMVSFNCQVIQPQITQEGSLHRWGHSVGMPVKRFFVIWLLEVGWSTLNVGSIISWSGLWTEWVATFWATKLNTGMLAFIGLSSRLWMWYDHLPRAYATVSCLLRWTITWMLANINPFSLKLALSGYFTTTGIRVPVSQVASLGMARERLRRWGQGASESL